MKSFIAVLLLASLASAQFPSYVKVCKRSVDLNKCIRENLEILRPHLKKGVPKLLIPPFDPLKIPSVEIESPNLVVKLKDLNIFHLDQFQVSKLEIDLDKNSFTTKLSFPTTHINGQYKLDGKLLLLQLNGAGYFNVNLTNTEAEAILSGNRIQKDGKSYINFTEHKIHLGINKAQIYFDDLFPNNEELTRNTNQVINDNVKEVLVDLQPVLEESIVGIVVNLISKIFLKFSADELFPK